MTDTSEGALELTLTLTLKDKMYMNKDDIRIKQQNKSANLINQNMLSGVKKTQKLSLRLIKGSVMKTSVVVGG